MDFFEENSEKSSQDGNGVVVDEYQDNAQNNVQMGVPQVAVAYEDDVPEPVAQESAEPAPRLPSTVAAAISGLVASTTAIASSASPVAVEAVRTAPQQDTIATATATTVATTEAAPTSPSAATAAGASEDGSAAARLKANIQKAAKRLLSREDSDSDSSDSDSSSSDSSTSEDAAAEFDGYVQTSAPAAIAIQEEGQTVTPPSNEQVNELKRLYSESKKLLEKLQAAGTSYGHTYSQVQIDNTFKYYLSQDSITMQHGITVFQFISNFFNTAYIELNLNKKIKESQDHIVNLQAKDKELKTQRLLSEGYDQNMLVKNAIQERGEEDLENIKTQKKANAIRGSNWGQFVPESELSNPEWFKQGVSKIIVDNPEKKNGGMHAYILYRILVFTKAGKIIMIQRRFNNLKKLNKDLKSEVHCSLPKMPSEKHWLLGGNQSQFVIKRVEEMRKYLESLTQTREVISSQAFRDFCLYGAQWRDISEGY